MVEKDSYLQLEVKIQKLMYIEGVVVNLSLCVGSKLIIPPFCTLIFPRMVKS